MASTLYRLAHLCSRHRRWVIIGWLLVLASSFALAGAVGGEKSSSFVVPGTESQRADDLLEERFPSEAGSAATVVFAAPVGMTLGDPVMSEAVEATLAEMARAPQVVGVGDPYAEEAISDDGRIGFTEVRYAVASEEISHDAIHELREAATTSTGTGLQVELRGSPISDHEESESHTAEIIGLVVAVIVLLFAFGSVLAAFTPILTGLVGVGITMSLLTILARWFEINEVGPTLALMIGLAVGIDYALFIVSRHRQNLRDGIPPAESVARACGTAGSAVLFAGCTVVIAISGLAIVRIPLLTSMGLSAATGVLVAVALALTMLPAVLSAFGPRIDRVNLPGMKPKVEGGQDAHATLSARWAKRVTSRPGRWLLVGVAIMGVLAMPATQMRLGIPDDSSLSTERTERRAFDLLDEGFGPGFNGPLAIVADLDDVPGAQRDAVLSSIETQFAGVEGVVAVDPAVSNEAGDTAVLTAIPSTGPAASETEDALHRLRDLAPEIAESTGAELSITGTTAVNIDLSEKLIDALPTFIAVVIGLTFVLLLVAFRSILVPLKAAVAILISILAAIGVVVAVFQWGWAGDLIGVSETMPLVAFLPVLMFAILFGLSMDYEVFILSRIREEHSRGLSNTDSVNHGIATTARIITAAALIMISVFGAFLLSNNTTVKMFGVGLSVAVLLDATVVRMIMVPSTMVLLREGNWWLPRWLDRIVPNVDIEGAQLRPAEPAPAHGVTPAVGRLTERELVDAMSDR